MVRKERKRKASKAAVHTSCPYSKAACPYKSVVSNFLGFLLSN